MNRRELLASAGIATGVAWETVLAPVKAVAAEAKPVRIKTLENFTIQIPITSTEMESGMMSRMGVTRVVTESGISGYSFTGGGGGDAVEAPVTGRRA